MIIDNSGELVWFRPLQREDQDVMDFKVQRYRGEEVLTFWEGTHTGYGHGEYVILDSSYQEIGRVRAGNGYRGDHHEFLISPQDTALFTIYGKVGGFDLSSVGGPKEGWALDGIAQEVDIETGEVLFEWHSLDHVGLDEIYGEPPDDVRSAYDYFHINSIEVDHDSNLLISSRRTSAVYKIDRRSGEVIWRLGGKKSDFKMGPGTQIRYQHDARRQSDGTITIFDNGAWKVDDESRGLALKLDMEKMTATVVRQYSHPEGWLSATQGNVQVLANTNVFIGWGSNPHFSEFSSDGKLLFDASFPTEVESYRAFRFPWSGHPGEEELAVAAERGSSQGDEVRLYASWNGATEVARWRVLAGSKPGRLKPVGSAARREDFETTIVVSTSEPYVGVRAEDSSGSVLGASKPVKLGTREPS
jgi:Arylsulfotransferase (ASST)